jgi:cellulase
MTLTTRLPRVTKVSEGHQSLNRHALIWKGPISYWLAKVDNAASAGTTGLQWFKVAHDGLANGKWAVDTMIANGGWHYFTMPTCIAPGDYLMRVELLALHSASSQGM